MTRLSLFFCAVLIVLGMPVSVFGQSLDDFRADADKAIALLKEGKPDEAAPLTKKLLEQAKERFSNEAAAAASLYMIASAYRTAQLFDEAVECLGLTIAIGERAFENDSTGVAVALNLLGQIYCVQGHYAEAVPILERVSNICEEKLDKGHPFLAILLSNLAEAYRKQECYADAEPLYKTIISNFDSSNTHYIEALKNLAYFYDAQGRNQDAEPLYELAAKSRTVKLQDLKERIKQSLEIVPREQRNGEMSRASLKFTINEVLGCVHAGNWVKTEIWIGILIDQLETFQSSMFYGALVSHRIALARRRIPENPTEIEEDIIQTWEKNIATHDSDHQKKIVAICELATIHQLGGRYVEAESLYKQAKELAEKHHACRDGLDTKLLYGLAELYRIQGRYAEAEPCYKQALDILNEEPDKNRLAMIICLGDLFEIYYSLGHYAEAEFHYKKLLKINEDMLESERDYFALSFSSCRFAELYRVQGRFEDAEPLYKQFLKIHKEKLGENHTNTVLLQTELACHYHANNRNEDAKKRREEAMNALERIIAPDLPDMLKVLSNKASLFFHMHLHEEAEMLFVLLLNIQEKIYGQDHFLTSMTMFNLARLYEKQDRDEDAQSLAAQAMTIVKNKRDNPRMEGFLELLLNYSFSKGFMGGDKPVDDVIWSHFLERKIDEFDDYHINMTFAMNNLAMLSETQGRSIDAISLYRQALTIREERFGKNHPLTATSLRNLADFYYNQSRFAEAEPLYDQTIAIYEGNPMAADSGQTQYANRSLLYKATKRSEKAVADLKRAMTLSLEVRKHASGSDEQRAATFGRYYDLFERMVDWQHELGDMNEAYLAMELSRAQGLQDLINSHGIDLLEGVPEEIAAELRRAETDALTAIKSAEKQIELLHTRKDRDETEKEEEMTRLNEILQEARWQYRNAVAAIKTASPSYRMMIGEDRKPIPLDTIQKTLEDEKSLALEYLVGDEKSYLLLYGHEMPPTLLPLVLDENQAELFGGNWGPVTSEMIDKILQNEDESGVLQSVVASKGSVNGNLDQKTVDKLAALWDVLIPDKDIRSKILDGSTYGRLLVLPDGGLAKLPFEMLIVSPDPVNPSYLLDRGPVIVYAPSASMYFNLKQLRAKGEGESVLTVGDPHYVSGTTTPSGNTRRSSRFGNLDRLEHTAAETSWIADSCKEHGISVIRLDQKESTEANVRQNIAGRRIVHLACHGMAEEEYGNMFGGLALTVGNLDNPKDDGFLELAEMFGLNLKGCDLAILSACETNLGPNQHGEGTWSMSRGVLASGARRVVTTNWQVADDSSARLVYLFVDAVNKNQTDPEYDHAKALREAKRSIRSGRNNVAWKHPYYWAPFVLIGDR